jgi:hypothetical protein
MMKPAIFKKKEMEERWSPVTAHRTTTPVNSNFIVFRAKKEKNSLTPDQTSSWRNGNVELSRGRAAFFLKLVFIFGKRGF